VSFLRRVLGGGSRRTGSDRDAGPDGSGADGADGTDGSDGGDKADAVGPDEAERARELELLRAEQTRHDELTERQLRYARHAWTPPRQGGERRADDKGDGGS
jgi:hypothetical protein